MQDRHQEYPLILQPSGTFDTGVTFAGRDGCRLSYRRSSLIIRGRHFSIHTTVKEAGIGSPGSIPRTPHRSYHFSILLFRIRLFPQIVYNLLFDPGVSYVEIVLPLGTVVRDLPRTSDSPAA